MSKATETASSDGARRADRRGRVTLVVALIVLGSTLAGIGVDPATARTDERESVTVEFGALEGAIVCAQQLSSDTNRVVIRNAGYEDVIIYLDENRRVTLEQTRPDATIVLHTDRRHEGLNALSEHADCLSFNETDAVVDAHALTTRGLAASKYTIEVEADGGVPEPAGFDAENDRTDEPEDESDEPVIDVGAPNDGDDRDGEDVTEPIDETTNDTEDSVDDALNDTEDSVDDALNDTGETVDVLNNTEETVDVLNDTEETVDHLENATDDVTGITAEQPEKTAEQLAETTDDTLNFTETTVEDTGQHLEEPVSDTDDRVEETVEADETLGGTEETSETEEAGETDETSETEEARESDAQAEETDDGDGLRETIEGATGLVRS